MEAQDRRTFLGSAVPSIVMGGGLVASYGTFATMAGRFLYPPDDDDRAWQFVARVVDFAAGASAQYRTPAGSSVTITRRGSSGGAEDFVALSSVCPHLGCKVHWEPHNNRFFCPCHNGAFDPSGRATAGPPAEARQSLPRYPLLVEDGLLFVEVQVTGFLARAGGSGELVDDARGEVA